MLVTVRYPLPVGIPLTADSFVGKRITVGMGGGPTVGRIVSAVQGDDDDVLLEIEMHDSLEVVLGTVSQISLTGYLEPVPPADEPE